ncbi:MAG: HlyD family efflux transporter periplasmic adaptor subunit [Planctomycetota bacterium]|nr:HlyD family efflux transporter periplasmic adaptor subunit [Planctomycetota bacterium]
MRIWIIAAVVVVAGLAGALFHSQHRVEPLKVSGFVEAHEIRLGSRVGGRVAEVHVEEGQSVIHGAKLVTLDPYDLQEQRARAQANVAAGQAAFDQMKSGYRAEEIAQALARRQQIDARLQRLVAGPRKQEIGVAEARLAASEAQRRLAELTYNRKKELMEHNAATRDELDRASEDLRASEAGAQADRQRLEELKEGSRAEEIAEAKAQLSEADEAWRMRTAGNRATEVEQARAALLAAQADLARIERQMKELVIEAPVDGVVEAAELRPGDLVAPNAPVLSLLDTSTLWVRAYVPENRLNLKPGQAVSVSTDSFPREVFKGRVTFIARQAEFTPGNVQTPEDRSKQVFRIKVTLDQGLDRLRPGMSADVWLDDTGKP